MLSVLPVVSLAEVPFRQLSLVVVVEDSISFSFLVLPLSFLGTVAVDRTNDLIEKSSIEQVNRESTIYLPLVCVGTAYAEFHHLADQYLNQLHHRSRQPEQPHE